MKKNLLITFLLISFKSYSATSKLNLKAPLDTRSEAMGSTGMIFGREYGALYFSPTSITSSEKFITGGLQAGVYEFDSVSGLGISGTLLLKIGNFILGPGIVGDQHFSKDVGKLNVSAYLPGAFALEVGDFVLGIGLKTLSFINAVVYETQEYGGGFSGLTSDLGISYKTFFGNFAISINNLFSFSSSSEHGWDTTLMRNLKLGYGKEIKIGYLVDSIKGAVELDNLLMENIYYINTNDNKDYSFFRKVRLGSEISFDLGNILYLDGRIGLKNFFPTLGLRISIANIFVIDYALTNEDLGNKWGKNRILFNTVSFGIGNFD